MNRSFDVLIRPGLEWELAHFFLCASSFDPYYGDMGIDLQQVLEARSVLREMILGVDWPVDSFPPNERGWGRTRQVFASPGISPRFKAWYYAWFRNVAYSHWGKRERFLFDTFPISGRPRDVEEALWWREKVRPVRRGSRLKGKEIEALKGKLDDWIPAPLQCTSGPDYLDLCDFAESTLDQWRLRVVMQDVLLAMPEVEIATLDAHFRAFCSMIPLVPRPLSCVFDRGLRNGDFRAEYLRH